jgi:hypothetical protein
MCLASCRRVYQVCRTDPSKKAQFIKCIFQMLSSQSPAVVFEAAGTLVTLSTAPSAVRAAAQAYTQLLNKEVRVCGAHPPLCTPADALMLSSSLSLSPLLSTR